MMTMNRFTIAVSLALLGFTLPAQDKPTDRTDALHLLQGTSTDGRLDPQVVARVEQWLGKVRTAHPEVVKIHVSPRHETGAALLFFDRLGREQLAKADWKIEAGRLMQQGKLGIPALDALQLVLGARLQRSGMPGASDMWIARFPKDLDVIAVCRRYGELATVETAEPNAYASFWGGHDDIFLHVRGDRMLFVFEQGGDGEAAPSHFRYFEVDTKAETIAARGELKPAEVMTARIHRWNVPERFSVGPFADFDAVVQACKHDDWWVARHGVEVIGHFLSGAEQPWFGEDFDHRERFTRVRQQLVKRKRDAYGAMLAGLLHSDPAVRGAALRWLRQLSKLEHGADAAGHAAFRRWVAEQLGR